MTPNELLAGLANSNSPFMNICTTAGEMNAPKELPNTVEQMVKLKFALDFLDMTMLEAIVVGHDIETMIPANVHLSMFLLFDLIMAKQNP